MKLISYIKVSLMSLGLIMSVQNYAVSAECVDLADPTVSLQGVIDQYKSYATDMGQGIYEICFQNAFSYDVPIALNGKGDNLIIKNLHLDPQSNFKGSITLLTLSGNITLDSATLTGNGLGTAIQVNGTNVAIQNSTIDNFEKGVVVAKDASVKLLNNKFIYDLLKDVDAMVSFDAGVVSPVKSLIGKVLQKDDPSKVQSVVGELNLTAEQCAGSVAMHLADKTTSWLLRSLENTKCDSPEILMGDVILKFADGSSATTTKGKCVFKCHDFSEDVSASVTFAYTDANNHSSPFVPVPPKILKELPDVISVMGPIDMPGIGSEANKEGGEAGGLIVVPDFQPPIGGETVFIEPTVKKDGKTQDSGATPASTSEKVGAGGSSGGCGGGQSIAVATSGSPLQFLLALIPLFAVLPIGYKRW